MLIRTVNMLQVSRWLFMCIVAEILDLKVSDPCNLCLCFTIAMTYEHYILCVIIGNLEPDKESVLKDFTHL